MSQEAHESQQDSASHFYDRISGVYDALSDSSEHEARELGLQLLDTSGDQQVLEIGFGTGHALVDIAKRLSDYGRVFGIDISPSMLEDAETRVRDAGLEVVKREGIEIWGLPVLATVSRTAVSHPRISS